MSTESTRAEGRDEPVAAGFTIHDYLSRPPGHLRLRRLPALLRLALSVVWRAARREFLLSCALQLLAAIGFGAQVLAVRNLVGDIAETDAVAYGSIVVLAAVTAGVALINIMLDVQQRIMGVKVAQHTTDQVIETATTVDLVTYESPAFHDALQRAQLSAQVRPLQLVAGVIGIGSTGLAIAGIGAALLVIQPVFFSLILLGFLPSWFATNRAHRLAYRFSIEQTERDRRRQYLFMVLTRKEEAQEVRAFGLGRFLGERHRALYESLITDTRVMLRRRLRISLAGQAASAIMLGLTIGFLVWLVTSDRITLAAAASAAGAMLLLNGRLTGFVGSVGSLYDGSLYLDDYATFVAAAPQLASRRGTRPAPEALERVSAEGVSFTYPSRAEPSLIDADLELRRGEVVALVGENGSGKTTFAKLLAGLYQPESGSITWDGVDLRDIDPSSAQSRVAVIFQDFVRWQLSAYANIALGDHEREHDAEAVSRAADAAGVHEVLNDLINGYETLLGPQFYGGSSLSGGEWQRVALARAFFRDAPLVILDEPTAALDAKAEAAMYARMGELFKGRGVLLISHRFGSVRTADRIYVLDKGRVVERGTHAELIALDGHYAELFRLQADRYID